MRLMQICTDTIEQGDATGTGQPWPSPGMSPAVRSPIAGDAPPPLATLRLRREGLRAECLTALGADEFARMHAALVRMQQASGDDGGIWAARSPTDHALEELVLLDLALGNQAPRPPGPCS